MTELHDITITPELAGQRLDQALHQMLPHISRSRIKALILSGAVSEGDAVLVKPSASVRASDELTLALPPLQEAMPVPEPIALDVLFEDTQVVVLNKPAGLVVHPAPGHVRGTLVNALLYHCGESLSGINGVKRPGIVHRLDKDTSGVMVVAKTDAAHQSLAEQFADHGRTGALERCYTAFVWGQPARSAFTLDGAIARDTGERQKMRVDTSGRGRFAITHITTDRIYGSARGAVARLACRLETGRTHQIRVHLAHTGHPLLGDAVYGAGFKTKAAHLHTVAQDALQALDRQALHATLLRFAHPLTGKILSFETPLPTDMARLEACLREQA